MYITYYSGALQEPGITATKSAESNSLILGELHAIGDRLKALEEQSTIHSPMVEEKEPAAMMMPPRQHAQEQPAAMMMPQRQHAQELSSSLDFYPSTIRNVNTSSMIESFINDQLEVQRLQDENMRLRTTLRLQQLCNQRPGGPVFMQKK